MFPTPHPQSSHYQKSGRWQWATSAIWIIRTAHPFPFVALLTLLARLDAHSWGRTSFWGDPFLGLSGSQWGFKILIALSTMLHLHTPAPSFFCRFAAKNAPIEPFPRCVSKLLLNLPPFHFGLLCCLGVFLPGFWNRKRKRLAVAATSK